MKRIVFFWLFLALLSVGLHAQETQNEAGAQNGGATIDALIIMFQFTDDDDVHLRELLNSYFFDIEANVGIITGDFLEVVSRINPRRFTTSRRTIYNGLLARMLDLIITNGGPAANKARIATACERLLFENRDALIFPKVAQVYTMVEDDSLRFSRVLMSRLQHIAMTTTNRETMSSVVETTIPLVTLRMNREVASDTGVVANMMAIYSRTLATSSTKVMHDLLVAILQ